MDIPEVSLCIFSADKLFTKYLRRSLALGKGIFEHLVGEYVVFSVKALAAQSDLADQQAGTSQSSVFQITYPPSWGKLPIS